MNTKKLLLAILSMVISLNIASAITLTNGVARNVPDSIMNVSVYPTIPADTVRIPVKIGSKEVNFVKKYNVPTNCKNVSVKLQQAIDELSAEGGGKLIIDKGEYMLGGIELRSNVHMLIDHRVIIRPYTDDISHCSLFHVGSRASDRPTVENVSIQGVGGRFKVILPKEMEYFTTKFVCINSSSVKDFYYANMDIYDNFTVMPTLGFGAAKRNDANFIGPTNGLVMNITVIDAHYGYGLVQAQAGRDIRFYNIHGIGGVTLRLETGSASMNKAQFGGVFGITGNNVSVANGHAGVICGPHGMHNGVCHFRNITSKSSGTGFSLGGESSGADGKGSGGTFADGTSVYNVTAIFGKHAQIKTKELSRIPEEYLSELPKPTHRGIIWDAPAHTCVAIQAKAKIDYDLSTFKSIGFEYGEQIYIADKKIEDKVKQKRMTEYLRNKYADSTNPQQTKKGKKKVSK